MVSGRLLPAIMLFIVLVVAIGMRFSTDSLTFENGIVQIGHKMDVPITAAVIKTGDAALIKIVSPSFLIRFLAPGEMLPMDPLYMIYFTAVSFIMCTVLQKNTDSSVFAHPAWSLLLITTALFFLVNLFRYNWFNSEISSLSGNKYSFNRQLLNGPEFWILLFLLPVYLYGRTSK